MEEGLGATRISLNSRPSDEDPSRLLEEVFKP